MKIIKNSIFCLTFLIMSGHAATGQTPIERYQKMQRQLAAGWNTWDTRSVLTHVLLPYGAAIDLNLTDADGERVNTFQIGDRSNGAPVMHPGAHTYDGAYTDISLEWKGLKLRVQSAAEGLTNVILVTPLEGNASGGRLTVVPKALWYRNVKAETKENRFLLGLYADEPEIPDMQGVVNGEQISAEGREISVSVDKPVVIAFNADMSVESAKAFIQSHADAFAETNRKKFGEYYDVYNAMQSVLAWDNIYDPTIGRVITPVSRIWNVGWSSNPSMGGFVLFCWDTYLAAMMLATGNRELAYANVFEMTDALTENGFVPNFYAVNNYKSRDRSQPPVGSLAVWNIYQKYKEKWFLELVYDNLLQWNRWWDKNRSIDGLLCWGSSPYEKVTHRWWEYQGVNKTAGGAMESGLDNSHMYDSIAFDRQKHVQKLHDVSLSSLYVMDCNLLAKIADELGKRKDADELRKRSAFYSKNMSKMWDEKSGLYYSRHTGSGKFHLRISPTCFYPMLANVPTQQQAERMVKEHLLNTDEFWGEWVIPSTPRNDPAFEDNDYVRGRIWAPLNFLVYMGLRNYNLPEARKELSEKSKNLLLKSWLKDGYVFENYSSVTGEGDDVVNSDKFYHWGALLGFITLIEEGYF
ncbi:MAG: hypothetical protein LBG92_12520 [Prevotellaceae bacterium]|jgi:hypothetical protein|nr:hypothetical protein [Prevotellaceae bacterium]